MELTNPFKAAIAERRLQIGLWQSLATPYTAEVCATAGFDWLVLDGEHAPNDVPLMVSQLQAVAAYPVHPVGRVAIGDPTLIKLYLDIGFTTILVPLVETAEQAALLARAVRYPPAGIRGVAASVVRASRWGAIGDYMTKADDEVCLLVQVETRLGLQNLASIAAVDGVDGVFIGPSDLSTSLGYRGNYGHADVRAAMEDALGVIHAAGKPSGMLMPDEAMARRYIALGCTFMAVGADVVLLAQGARALAARYQAAPAQT